ncbi:DNA replication licensing factor Mcm5 [Leguminivora glycinivorella]|uniref:DNA replication licensing factor Mcm5 n=1 Tax=Leguminivora glycinivorella TaxID=1035111 RepID=UPI00200E00D5|nr:DNA replication licensing factor Mcm5 [Leguminivora glycinivorella]
MEGFDDPGVFFSDNFGVEENESQDQVNLQAVKKKFKEFIRQFHVGNFNYKYRDALKRNYNLGKYWVEINIEDLSSFDEVLAEKLYKKPSEHLPILEEAAKELVDELTAPRPEGEETVEDIQVLLSSDAHTSNLRELKSETVSRLVKIPGIVISASGIKAKATKISIQCRSCRVVIPNLLVKPGLEGYVMPRKCNTEQAGRPKCPLDPYFIIPDKCKCIDYQVLKLQEAPESIPQGEMPRHLSVYCERVLCERVAPGARVQVLGIYSIKKIAKQGREGRGEKSVGVRSSYLRAVGLSADEGATGGLQPFTADEEEQFRRLAASPDIYERISMSIAPSVFGAVDMKKAIACLLFGGARKRLPDGLTRRGDINILLLGDPGTAKSQLLKFVEKVSPIGVYTSGKGSSAAGLTASVIRDPGSRNFVMEGGAMVLADGGVVCIDEFDKMREDDRVAIHEAMEQQTISIAKAGITTTLNSRCSVLAAANSVFGRWDDTKADDNIDFMPTILSRFDMIFIVKDEHDQNRDITLAKHIISVHMGGDSAERETAAGSLPLALLRRYAAYCRARCGPRLAPTAAERLQARYVLMRTGALQHERQADKRLSIPITVRQLEAIVRISESLAKMQLQPFATEAHVTEALRLFQVSTLDAAMTGSLAGAEGFTSEEDHEMLSRVEKQLKRRFAVGSQVSEQTIIQDFLRQKYPERAIQKVIHTMIRRGELQHRLQRKMLYRLS